MSYSVAPHNAWAGWRLRIPGGPQGGQYHGFIAPDDLVDNSGGWPAGHDEIFRPIDNRQNLGIYPWHPWADKWHGSPLKEGETVSDFVYRSPAELRPRPNATGGINVVRSVQHPRTPGYAVAPGNYKTLGLYAGFGATAPQPTQTIIYDGGPGIQTGLRMPTACPAWGCGPPPWTQGGTVQPTNPYSAYGGLPCPAGYSRNSSGQCITTAPLAPIDYSDPECRPDYQGPRSMIATMSHQCWDGSMGVFPCRPCPPEPGGPFPISPGLPIVTQPPPPTQPSPSPVVPIGPVGTNGCAVGQYRDAAGNCTSDWRNPYPMNLPLDNTLAPSPTVGASTCPTGYSQDSSGNCLAPGIVSGAAPTTGTGITGWLAASTSLGGMHIPNYLIAGVGVYAAIRLMKKK